MAKEKNRFKFSGSFLNDIIGRPLISIARAQNMMAREQVKSIMESCFHFDGEVYQPILLKMTVTRSSVTSDTNNQDFAAINQTAAIFHLPMITIFPISSLGVENADINFNVEILSQYENQPDEETPFTNFLTDSGPRMEWMGRIASNEKSDDSYNTSQTSERGGSIHVNVEARTLPLTKGLLEIIEIYSSSFQISTDVEKQQPSRR